MTTTTYAYVKFIIDDRPPAIPTSINRDDLNPNTKDIIIIIPKYYETTIFVLFKLTLIKNNENINIPEEKDIKIIAILEILKFNDSISIQKYQTIESISYISNVFILSALNSFNFKDIYVFSRPTNNLIFYNNKYLKSKILEKYWENILNDISLITNNEMILHKFKDISDIKTLNCKSRVIFPDTPEYKSIEYLDSELIKNDPGFDILKTKKKTLYEIINYRQDFMGSPIFHLKNKENETNKQLIKSNIINKEEILKSIKIMNENCFTIKTKKNPLKYLNKLTIENNIYLVWDLIDNYGLEIKEFQINKIKREINKNIKIINIKINKKNTC